MLSIAKLSSPSGALSYYEKDGYYSKDDPEHIQATEWFGRGARELDLKGYIKADQFQSILAGQVPNGPQLGRMIKGELTHFPGTDLTFSAPKSVSILAETGPDKILRRVHDRAVKSTLTWMEKNILETRIFSRETLEQEHKNDQKMITALFRHNTSRDLDPQLHTHAVIANMVQGQDGKWRSFDNNSLYLNKLLMGAMYRSHLAQNLARLGITMNQTHADGRFEISKVPSELLDLFSSRAKTIREKAKEFGTSNPATLEKITLMSRSAKKEVNRDNLRQKWTGQIKEAGFTMKQLSLHYARIFINRESSRGIADKAIEHSRTHLSERSAVFTEQNLKIIALGYALGKARPAHIDAALNRALEKSTLQQYKTEQQDNTLYTTPEMIRLEQKILQQHDKGKLATDPFLSSSIINEKLQDTPLNPGQKNAVILSLTSVNRFIGIQGSAGTGKTTLLKQVKQLSQYSGLNIMGLAPSSSAANTLSEETKIPSQTLSSFLAKFDGVIHDRLTDSGQKELKNQFKNTMVILDESSFASSKQMYGLLKIANEIQIPRVILVGDTKQLEAVEAGIPFNALQKSGMRTAKVTEIVRQRNEVTKETVEHTLGQNINAAFRKLGNNIHEFTDTGLAENAADRWLALSPALRQSTAIIAPTHESVDKINELIHDKLFQEGQLGEKSLHTEVLKPVNLTQIQKSLAKSYQPEQRILFNFDYKSLNIKRGDLLTICSVDQKKGLIHLEGKKGEIDWIPSKVAGKRHGAIEVYNAKEISLNENEHVRWTKNNHKLDLSNNENATITKITDSAVTLETDRGFKTRLNQDDLQLKHMTYAYASTIHAAQGKTVDNLIAVMESGRPALNNQKSFYVTVSRAKNEVELLTDNTLELQKSIERNTGESIAALDLFNQERDNERAMEALAKTEIEQSSPDHEILETPIENTEKDVDISLDREQSVDMDVSFDM